METSGVSSGVAAALAGLSSGQTGAAVGTAVLRKALDLQSQNAMQLIESLPQPGQYNNPPNLGQSVDVRA